MAFELYMVDDLIRLAGAGAGFRIDAGLRLTNDLVRIAAAAAQGGARITFAGMALRPRDDVIRIAAAGRGNISFDD
ncbi:hypothetical protein [Burkholderia anthina]|uniref:hypothetical protein n=1 Tax=Burkholderia anthina TaxID=179879 RepID=UPI0037BFADC8